MSIIAGLNSLLDTPLDDDQIAWIFESDGNYEFAEEIRDFLLSNGSDESQDFAQDLFQLFLNSDINFDWSQIENWFLEEQTNLENNLNIDPELITYDSALTLQALPSMDDFVNNFPKNGTAGNYSEMPTSEVYELVGGSLWTSHQNDIYNNYQNACSIRGSRGLLYSGIDIPVLNYPGVGQRTQKGGDNNNYILDAVSFNKFMRDKFGNPTYELSGQDADDLQQVTDLLQDKNGIYVIINNSRQQAGYSGHVDAIIDGECISNAYANPPGGVKTIAIWELD